MVPARRIGSEILWMFAALIAAASFSFMMHAALNESAIVDEAAHIPAGYSYVSELDFRLNPEHPPLVKALAALPLLIVDPYFPTDIPAWTSDINGQWAMGENFLYKSGNDADQIVAVSRLMPILLTVLTILFIYFWSKKMVGGAWALLPTFLFAFSPTVLAHGHYVTTDLGAAFGILFATYFFLKFLKEPSPKNILIAGAALGVAELLKFSAVLLFPYFAILAAVHFFVNAKGLHGKYFWQTAWNRIWKLAAVVAVAFILIIYPVYGLFTANYPAEKQMSDTAVIMADFAATTASADLNCSGPKHCLANAELMLTGNSITRPIAEYFLGVLMVLHRSTNGNTAYFLGEVSAAGSHWYFPIVYFLKESLPALIIVLGALLATLWRLMRNTACGEGQSFGDYMRKNFTGFALILFLLIYWAYSINSNLNIGVRHLMPVIPIMYMLSAGVWKRWVMGQGPQKALDAISEFIGKIKSLAVSWFKLSILCALLIWVALETFGSAPYFLSYFNQIGGGTWGGYRYATDSNYDWGQDMLRLKDFVDSHPEIDKIGVDYFGTSGAPVHYLGKKEIDWWSAKGNPADQDIHWLAISTYTLQNLLQPTAPDYYRKPEDGYPWLAALRQSPPGMGQVPEPDYRVGTTIFVYKL